MELCFDPILCFNLRIKFWWRPYQMRTWPAERRFPTPDIIDKKSLQAIEALWGSTQKLFQRNFCGKMHTNTNPTHPCYFTIIPQEGQRSSTNYHNKANSHFIFPHSTFPDLNPQHTSVNILTQSQPQNRIQHPT